MMEEAREKNNFIDKVKYRNQLIDAYILHLVESGEAITPEEIAYISKRPLKLIKQRLDVLSFLGIVENAGGCLHINREIKAILKQDANFPLNADDLELTPREKLVVLALSNLGIADTDTIMEWLKLNGNHSSKLNIYFALKKLVDLGVVEELRKGAPMLNLKGRKIYYSLKEQIMVFDTVDSLLEQCKEYYERKFKRVDHA